MPGKLVKLEENRREHALWRMARPAFVLFLLACVGMVILSGLDFLAYAHSHASDFVPFAPYWSVNEFTIILGRFGFSLEGWLQFRLFTSLLMAAVFISVGSLIFLKKGNDPFGLYVAGILVLFGAVGSDLLTAFLGIHPELNAILIPFGVLAWCGFFNVLFLFPNGHFVPRWTRWMALLLLALYMVVILGYGGAKTPPIPLVAAILVLFGIGAVSQIYRYRNVSNAIERQQTKWVMAALVMASTVLILSILPGVVPEILSPGSPANLVALVTCSLPSLFSNIIPVAIAFAILRYHLWDIDLIIRRTLQYTLLTVILGLIYLGGVLVLQQVFLSLTGQQSDLALVLSTLGIAALFQPLRRRVQGWISRRFYRSAYDTQKILEGYAALARNKVELEQFNTNLIEVVQRTVQPAGIGLWISGAKKGEER